MKRRARRSALILPAALLLCGAAPVAIAEQQSYSVTIDADGSVETPDEPVPVHLAGVRMIGPEQALLVLADEEERRAVPIAVGKDQGLAIYLGQEKTPTPRPMTHDLMVQILNTLEVDVEMVIITDLREGTYFAEIALKNGRKKHRIDARPSDAIALAVRLDVPILAFPALLTTIDDDGAPSDTVEDGRRFGITVQELSADLAEYMEAVGVPGVLVASVAKESPADIAGLRRGDILQRLDGRATDDLESYLKAVAMASRFPSFDVWRDGEQLTLVRP
jgi:bifunctional DNase/RNase